MKQRTTILLILFQTVIAYYGFGQTEPILSYRNDSLFVDDTMIGVVEKRPEFIEVRFRTIRNKLDYKSGFKNQLIAQYPDQRIKYIVDYTVGYPKIDFVHGYAYQNRSRIGKYQVSGEKYDFRIRGTITTSTFPDSLYNYFGDELVNFVRDSLEWAQGDNVNLKAQVYTYFEEEILKQRELERQRQAQFFENIATALRSPLDPVEGVYRSIDGGESFEYDIFVYRSQSDPEKYIGWVMNSTDTDLSIGAGIFSLRKTARPDAFFLEYQNKAGYQFDNKLASYSNSVLEIGLKSFIKLYPAGGVTYYQPDFMPSADWKSSGSGVLLNRDGYVATNHHVIDDADSIIVQIQMPDSSVVNCRARVLTFDKDYDVALLRISEDQLPQLGIEPIKFNFNPKYGDEVYSLGFPIASQLGENVKLNKGIVSALTDQQGSSGFFQTDLPLWYGNSGGPCFSDKGELLGLAASIDFDREMGVKLENVSFITKSRNIERLFEELNYDFSSDGSNSQLSVGELVPYAVFIKVY